MSRDEPAEASVLTLLQAFDAFEDALRRRGGDVADTVLEAAVARVHATLGDHAGEHQGEHQGEPHDGHDLAAQMRVLLDALRELSPAAPRPPRPRFRPALR